MALPKRRHSPTRRDKRRTHYKLTAPVPVECPRCHAPRLPHHVCTSCGYYDDRLVLDIKAKEKTKE